MIQSNVTLPCLCQHTENNVIDLLTDTDDDSGTEAEVWRDACTNVCRLHNLQVWQIQNLLKNSDKVFASGMCTRDLTKEMNAFVDSCISKVMQTITPCAEAKNPQVAAKRLLKKAKMSVSSTALSDAYWSLVREVEDSCHVTEQRSMMALKDHDFAAAKACKYINRDHVALMNETEVMEGFTTDFMKEWLRFHGNNVDEAMTYFNGQKQYFQCVLCCRMMLTPTESNLPTRLSPVLVCPNDACAYRIMCIQCDRKLRDEGRTTCVSCRSFMMEPQSVKYSDLFKYAKSRAGNGSNEG